MIPVVMMTTTKDWTMHARHSSKRTFEDSMSPQHILSSVQNTLPINVRVVYGWMARGKRRNLDYRVIWIDGNASPKQNTPPWWTQGQNIYQIIYPGTWVSFTSTLFRQTQLVIYIFIKTCIIYVARWYAVQWELHLRGDLRRKDVVYLPA